MDKPSEPLRTRCPECDGPARKDTDADGNLVHRSAAIAGIEKLIQERDSLREAAWANGLERDEANDRLEKIRRLLYDRHNAVRIEAARELARPARLTKDKT